MNDNLQGKKVAILATDGFEQGELDQLRGALEDAGADTRIVSPKQDTIKGWDGDRLGETVPVDMPLKNARPEDYAALLLPGGVMNPAKSDQVPEAVEFVRAFFHASKPVAAICHGPQLLIDADVLRGRKLTSYPSIKNDLINAGADWVDDHVVVDRGLVTSRGAEDLLVFNERMIEEFSEGIQAWQRA